MKEEHRYEAMHFQFSPSERQPYKNQVSIGRWHSHPGSGRRGCFFGI
jgi:hypothetical protein